MPSPIYTSLEGNLPLRLLRILPGSSGETVTCELFSTTLENRQHRYEATSYTWGERVDKQAIVCNGRPLLIQKNAFQMLSHLRSPDRSRTVWIDAICINQDDTQEKSTQVRLMHKIYAMATAVVVWLGVEDLDSSTAMAFAHSLDPADAVQQLTDYIAAGYGAADRVWQRKSYLFDDESRPPSTMSALVSLMSRPYFNRIWIQQEAAMCERTIVTCGPKTVEWNRIFALAWLLLPKHATRWPEYIKVDFHAVQSNLLAMVEIQSYRVKVAMDQAGSPNRYAHFFRDRLQFTQRYGATNPSDKIYALRNLSKDPSYDEWAPLADYSVPWQVLYVDIAIRMLKMGWLAHVLRCSGTARHGHDWEVASFVPDYRQRPGSEISRFTVHEVWNAGGQSYYDNKPINQLAATVRLLPKTARRQFQTDELRQAKAKAKELLQSYVGLRCLMRDQAVYLSRDWDDVAVWRSETDEYVNFPQAFLEIVSTDLDHIRDHFDARYMTGDTAEDAYKVTLIAATDHRDRIIDASFVTQHWPDWIEWLRRDAPGFRSNDPNEHVPIMNSAIENAESCKYFRFCITQHGYFCLVPNGTRLGDEIAVLKGYGMPVVLRPRQDYFEFFGDAYVHGMMRNETTCVRDEFGCRRDLAPEQLDRMHRDADIRWKTLGLGDYTRVLPTIGEHVVHLI